MLLCIGLALIVAGGAAVHRGWGGIAPLASGLFGGETATVSASSQAPPKPTVLAPGTTESTVILAPSDDPAPTPRAGPQVLDADPSTREAEVVDGALRLRTPPKEDPLIERGWGASVSLDDPIPSRSQFKRAASSTTRTEQAPVEALDAAETGPGPRVAAAAPAESEVAPPAAAGGPAGNRFAIYLATFPSHDLAQTGWQIVQRRYKRQLEGLQPRVVAGKDAQGERVFRLFAGPFESVAASRQRCRALASASVNCKPADFTDTAAIAGTAWEQ